MITKLLFINEFHPFNTINKCSVYLIINSIKKNVILRLLEWCWVAIKLIKKVYSTCQSKYDYVM